jgi:hypothetical protein
VLSWHGGWQEAERAYLLWKARQVADQQGSGAVAVPPGGGGGGGGEGAIGLRGARLKGDLFPELMEYMSIPATHAISGPDGALYRLCSSAACWARPGASMA